LRAHIELTALWNGWYVQHPSGVCKFGSDSRVHGQARMWCCRPGGAAFGAEVKSVDALSEWLVGSSTCLVAEYPGWRLVWGFAEERQNKRVHVHATAHRRMSRCLVAALGPCMTNRPNTIRVLMWSFHALQLQMFYLVLHMLTLWQMCIV